MEFCILGPLEIRDDEGRLLSLSAGRQRALLAVLLLHANAVVSTDRLVDDLWRERTPETAATALQGYVSQLRRLLEPGHGGRGVSDGLLATRAPGYVLRVEAGALDAHRFERLLAEGSRALAGGEAEEAAATLREALSLWRGPALSEFAFEPFAQVEITRLEEQRLACLEERIEADLACGRHDNLVPELEALVAQHPLRERLRRQLMLALYRSDRQADALQEYQRARRILVQELGLEPGDALRRLELAILAHDPALDAPVAAVPRRAPPATTMSKERSGPRRPRRKSLRAAVPLSSDSVVLIDPEREQVVGLVSVGRRPVAVACGHDSVWVANADDATISRIDPETREVARTIGIGAPAIDLAVSPDAVWVATGSSGTLIRIDPDAEAVVETIDLRGSSELVWNTTYAVDADAAAVWVATGPRSLLRIDLATNEIAATIDVGHVPVSVACGAGAVWVTTVAERALRIEPQTNAITAEASTGYPVAAMVGEEAVWVIDGRGRLWSIDPNTATVIQAITVGQRPVGLFAGDGAVWLANNADGTVLRVDPVSGHVDGVFTVGHAPTDVAIGDGILWVSVQSERVM